MNSSYDDMDRVATVTHPNGEVITYRNGDHGLPIALESSVKGAIVRSVTYNALGKPFDLALGNGLTTSYRYWGTDYTVYGSRHYGMPYTITTLSASLQSLTYDYDWVGNVKSLTDGRNNETINFTYDDLDRLTLASCPSYGEVYAYDAIGNMTSKGGVTHNFPVPADHQARPHAPTWVNTSSNPYGYDNNGNLTSAEGRTYEYNVENRLTRVLEGGSPLRTFAYDADGALRWVDQSGQKTHYVTPDYQVNVATGEVSVYYRFGGRAVAWRNNSGLRYLLADHLSSSHGEVGENQAEMGQRRYTPFGSDRTVPGANDIGDEERFTSQRRIDAGGGNSLNELYHYGARWYLPGVGVFTQPDTIVPDNKNPQALNRYTYGYNNPVKYIDPSGHFVLLVGGVGTGNDEQENAGAWGVIMNELGLDPTHQTGEERAFFNWGDEPGAPSVLPMEIGASRLHQQIAGKTDIKLIGHSRGGALVMEYSAEVAEGKLAKNEELKGVYSIDGALSPANSLVKNPIADERYSGGIGPFFRTDRYANLPQKLAGKGLVVNIATFDNSEDFSFTTHPPIAGAPYLGWAVKPEGGFRTFWSYWYAAHGLLQRDPRVGAYIRAGGLMGGR